MPLLYLSKAQLLNLATTGVRAGGAVAMQKLVALRYGPEGVWLLGQFLLLQALCYGLLTDGLNRAMMVEAGHAPTLERRLGVLAKGGGAAGLLMLATALLVWPAIEAVLPPLAAVALPLALCIGAGGFFWWVASTLQFEDFPGGVLALTLVQATLLVGAAALPWAWMPHFLSEARPDYILTLPDRLLLAAIGQAGLSLLAGGIYQFILRRSAGAGLGQPSHLIRKIWTYGGLSLAVLVAGRGSDLAVRAYAEHLGYGPELGLWQAAVRLGDLVLVPITPLFTFVFFAEAAQMREADIRFALKGQLRLGMLGALGIGILVMLAPWVLPLLNRADFVASTEYFNRQALGDVFRILSLPLSIALLAAGRLKALAWLEVISLTSYLAAAAGCFTWMGPLGLPWAHTLRYAAFFVANLYAARDLLPWFARKPASTHA